MRRLTSLALLLAATACTVGPNYKAPEPQLPANFAGPRLTAPQPGAEVDLAHWWEAFGDPEMSRLIAVGLAQAPDLQTAASRVRQARLGIIEARSAGLPQVNATGTGQYLRYERVGNESDIPDLARSLSSGSGTGAGGSSGLPSDIEDRLPSDYKNVGVGFDASWELDIFGGVRRQVQSARATAEAAEWNARDARVRLAAEIASDYLQMRGYQEQRRIAQGEADRQARSLDILQHTAQVGLVPQGNAIRQRTQLAQARAQIAPLEGQALAQMHALAVLVGEPPETLIDELKVERPLPAVPPAVPPGLPVDLIRRRPDVRAAERQLAAATADIGVAVADLYPRITLSAMPQLAAAWLGGFFIGKSFTLSASGAASFPVLDFGRRRAAVDTRIEQREQAYIQWRQAVLQALRDVEDSLVQLEAERRSNAELTGGVADARRSLSTVEAQFRVGLSDYTPVLNAQQQLLQAENSLAQSNVRVRQDLASLYKALGGGWTENDPPPVRPVITDLPKR